MSGTDTEGGCFVQLTPQEVPSHLELPPLEPQPLEPKPLELPPSQDPRCNNKHQCSFRVSKNTTDTKQEVGETIVVQTAFSLLIGRRV